MSSIPGKVLAAATVLALVLVGGAGVWAWQQWIVLDTALPWLTMAIRVGLFAGLPAFGLALVWRWLGLSSSIHRWFDVLSTISQSYGTRGLSTIQYKPAITSTAAELPALPDAALTLPATALLSGVLADLPKGQLAYGILPDGNPLLLPLAGGFHILAHGDTQSGKTTFIDSHLVQLHQQARHYPLRLICGDFKRELRATWGRSPLLQAIETDPQTIAELIDDATRGKDGILDRYQQFQQLGDRQGRIVRNMADYVKVTGGPLPLTFVVIDELNAVLEAADRATNLASALKIALQLGAGAGVYLLGGAQYLSSATFGRDGSKQFVTRCHFGAFDPTAIRLMFGEKLDTAIRALLTGQPGRGLIRTAGQAQPTPFQALKCEEGDILGAIRLLTADQPTMPRMPEPTEPLNHPRTASEPAEPAFTNGPISPEVAAIIRNLVNQGWSKTKVIETLFNTKRGGSANYKELSAAYDTVVNGGPR